MSVAEKLQEVIDWSDKKQKEVARLTGISTSTLSGYVRGDRKITLEAAQKIADALDISVWVLLNGDPLPVTPQDVTRAELEMLSEYRQLTGVERAAFDQMLKAFNHRK